MALLSPKGQMTLLSPSAQMTFPQCPDDPFISDFAQTLCSSCIQISQSTVTKPQILLTGKRAHKIFMVMTVKNHTMMRNVMHKCVRY